MLKRRASSFGWSIKKTAHAPAEAADEEVKTPRLTSSRSFGFGWSKKAASAPAAKGVWVAEEVPRAARPPEGAAREVEIADAEAHFHVPMKVADEQATEHVVNSEVRDLVAEERVYTRWWNMNLKQVNLSVDDLTEDFKSGVLPIRLLEVLTATSLGACLGEFHEEAGVDKSPSNVRTALKHDKMLENQHVFLKALEGNGHMPPGIRVDDMVAGNTELVLGLTWMLILRFEIHQLHTTVLELFSWAMSIGDKHNVAVHGSWSTAFNDGILFSAIVLDCMQYAAPASMHNAVQAGQLSYNLDAARAMVPAMALSAAFDAAAEHLGVARLLESSDFNGPTIPDRSVIL
jgi:hypothetical protein